MDIVLSSIIAVVGACWAYGSAGAAKRAAFKEWLAGTLSAMAPHLRWLVLKSMFLAITMVCAAVVVSVWIWVSAFLTNEEPMQRKEVFFLCIQLFNGLTYGSAFFAFLFLTIRRLEAQKKHQENLMLLGEGERLVLSVVPDADLQALAHQLADGDITVTFKGFDSAKVIVVVEMPSLLVERIE
ncbi:hypothetical protein [Pseudomonas sp. MOIL14HWK12:I2]|uniref:hypothetical protein n=1 Tax=Pseudomonas sp. MOIL14HWK12:I2 TaxID=1033994 RepID=UPI0004842DC4|nr:hypothetical protein [Pseudomonas sp. MOIL14HWK12:I2]